MRCACPPTTGPTTLASGPVMTGVEVGVGAGVWLVVEVAVAHPASASSMRRARLAAILLAPKANLRCISVSLVQRFSAIPSDIRRQRVSCRKNIQAFQRLPVRAMPGKSPFQN